MSKLSLNSITEKFIISLVVFLFISILSYQVIINTELITDYIGINIGNFQKSIPNPNDNNQRIFFKLNNHNKYKKVRILVNGDVVNDFIKSNEISITIFNNDVIEIDGSMYSDIITVEIVNVSSKVTFPNSPKKLIINNKIEYVGKVKLN